jgi:hypothetical protein
MSVAVEFVRGLGWDGRILVLLLLGRRFDARCGGGWCHNDDDGGGIGGRSNVGIDLILGDERWRWLGRIWQLLLLLLSS